jgi:5-formyltetrahydrofolate cyclo-ligase
MGDAYDQDKQLVRRRMRAARAELPPEDAARRSAAVCARLLRMPAFVAARHVVAYAAIGRELDPAAAVEAAAATGKRVYLPSSEEPDFLSEPGGQGRVRLSTRETPLFLVPGLAFDLRGVRLGRGNGWYDRALARYPDGVRIGLAYDFQVVPSLPEAPWDVRMHAVATEARLIGSLPESGR